MRHGSAKKKLNRTTSHRRALYANMAVAVITHEQIKTTLAKAKIMRSVVDKLITLGKHGTLADRRLAFARLRDEAAVAKLFAALAKRYKDRAGGYTRVIHAGFRYGDAADMAYLELVDRDVKAKGANPETRPAAEAKAADAAKDAAPKKPRRLGSMLKKDAPKNS